METIAGGPPKESAAAAAAFVSPNSWEFALRLALVLVCFLGLCLVLLPWVRVQTAVRNPVLGIFPGGTFPGGMFGLPAGIGVQEIVKGYQLWQGLLSGAIFLLLGGQLLATLQWRRPAPWRYGAISLGGMAVVILSASILLSPPTAAGGGSAPVPFLMGPAGGQAAITMEQVPGFAPWLTAVLGLCILGLVGGSMGLQRAHRGLAQRCPVEPCHELRRKGN